VRVRLTVANIPMGRSLVTMSHAQAGDDLTKQMEALRIHTALLIPSQEGESLRS